MVTVQMDSPMQMVKLLKGAPLAVLMLLNIAQRAGQGLVGAEWLARHSGYTDKPVSQALALLEEYGLAARSGRSGWQLANDARQHPLMSLLDGEPGAAVQPPPQNETENIRLASSIKPDSSQDFNKESTLDSSPDLNKKTNLESGLVSFNENLAGTRSEYAASYSAVMAELERFGIREPARSRLAMLNHVTPELIRGHCQTTESTGQAIYRIEKNWAVARNASAPISYGKPAWEDYQPTDRNSNFQAETVPPAASAPSQEAAQEQVKPDYKYPNFKDEDIQIWQDARAALQDIVSPEDYKNHIEPTRLDRISFVGSEYWVATQPTREGVFQFLIKGFNTLVAETLTKISGRKIGFICFGTHTISP